MLFRPLLLLLTVVPVGQAQPPVRLDRHGDPLPAEAVLRLGTTRLRQGEPVSSLAFSPDGARVVSGSMYGPMRLWDVSTGKKLDELYGEPQLHVTCVTFSPDGKTVLWGSETGYLRSWGKRGPDVGLASAQLEAIVRVPAVDQVVVAAGPQAFLLDGQTGKRVRPLENADQSLKALAVAPDGKLLAGAQAKPGDCLCFWDLSTGKRVPFKVQTDRHEVAGIAFSPDGKLLAAASFNGLDIYDAHVLKLPVTEPKAIKPLRSAETGHGLTLFLAFSPDSKTLALADRDGGRKVTLWDVAAHKARLVLPLAMDHPRSLAFAPDGKLLGVGCDGGAIRLFDPATGRERFAERGHVAAVSRLVFSKDGKTLASTGDDGVIRVWDTGTGEPRGAAPGHDTGATALDISPDGARLASGGTHDDIRLWSVAPLKETGRLEGPYGHPAMVLFGPDGKSLLSVGGNGGARFWDLATRKELRKLEGRAAGIAALFGAADRRFLAALVKDPAMAPQDAPVVKRAMAALPTGFYPILIAPDGKTMVSMGGGPATLRLTRIEDKASVTFEDVWEAAAPAFSPDGRVVAVVRGGQLVLWEAATLTPRRSMPASPFRRHALAFSPDGRLLAVAHADHAILLFDVPGKVADAALESLWDSLGAADGERAGAAVWALADRPEKAVPFLRERLLPPAVDAKRLEQLLDELESPAFATRERAQRELERLADRAQKALERRIASRPALESLRRQQRLLDKITGPAGRIRRIRGVEAIGHAATTEAVALLNELTCELPGTLLGEESRRAAARLRDR